MEASIIEEGLLQCVLKASRLSRSGYLFKRLLVVIRNVFCGCLQIRLTRLAQTQSFSQIRMRHLARSGLLWTDCVLEEFRPESKLHYQIGFSESSNLRFYESEVLWRKKQASSPQGLEDVTGGAAGTKERHFSYYAYSGGDGAVRWKHDSKDFRRDGSALSEQLLPQHNYKLDASALGARHFGEAECREFREAVLDVMPHRWVSGYLNTFSLHLCLPSFRGFPLLFSGFEMQSDRKFPVTLARERLDTAAGDVESQERWSIPGDAS